jgi:Flp pilus assembly protein TadG
MSRTRSSRGQSLVEFALVIPLFLTLLFTVVDFGRVVWANDSLANAAREAARFAIVHGGTKTTACPVGPAIPNETVIPIASASCPSPSPSKLSIVAVAQSFSIAGGAPLVVDVCYGTGCSGSTDTAAAIAEGAKRGTPVTVTVSSTVDLVTGRLLGRASFGVSATSTMLVNH